MLHTNAFRYYLNKTLAFVESQNKVETGPIYDQILKLKKNCPSELIIKFIKASEEVNLLEGGRELLFSFIQELGDSF